MTPAVYEQFRNLILVGRAQVKLKTGVSNKTQRQIAPCCIATLPKKNTISMVQKKGGTLWALAKGIGALCGLCCIYLTYFLVSHLPGTPALRSKHLNFEKSENLPGLSHLATGPGRVPTLGNVSFRGHQLRSWRLNLNLVSVERGGQHFPCLQSSQKIWHLECGGVTAEWETKTFQLMQGIAFRWHVMFHTPVRQLQISAWLPSAAVEGQVDGSPVVARHRKEMARLVASYTASSSFPGKGPERLLDDDTETEWFAGKGEQDAWILLDLEGAFDSSLYKRLVGSFFSFFGFYFESILGLW